MGFSNLNENLHRTFYITTVSDCSLGVYTGLQLKYGNFNDVHNSFLPWISKTARWNHFIFQIPRKLGILNGIFKFEWKPTQDILSSGGRVFPQGRRPSPGVVTVVWRNVFRSKRIECFYCPRQIHQQNYLAIDTTYSVLGRPDFRWIKDIENPTAVPSSFRDSKIVLENSVHFRTRIFSEIASPPFRFRTPLLRLRDFEYCNLRPAPSQVILVDHWNWTKVTSG